MPDRSSVPLTLRHPPDDMVLRLEMLRDEAEACGQGTLADLIELAMIEARRFSDQARRKADERGARPGDLWLPPGS